MPILYRHRPGYGAVQLGEELTPEAVAELLSIVDTLVDVYCYDVVELIVSSPGGSTRELTRVIEALQERREQGLRVRTRVDSCAQSAAALLVCAGDERIAEPGAQLLFHAVHAAPGHTVTASEASALGRTLAGTDESVVEFLASRAFIAPAPERAIGAEGSDRPVLEALARACTRRKRRPRSVAALARLIAECVDSALTSGDRAALARIYRRLLAVGRPISGRLAVTLRLIDRVGTASEDAFTPAQYPGPVVPEWARLYPPTGYFPRDELTRHVLALGEPGSGKTTSAVVPLLYPLADASLENVSTGLVVDPTGELTRLLAHFPAERPVVHLRSDTVVLDVMAGPRWSLDADLADGRWLTAAHRIVRRVASLAPAGPARALGPHAARSDAGRFDCEGAALVESLVAFVLMTTDPEAPAPASWLARCPEGLRWMEALLERARGDEASRGPNALALTAWLLQSPLVAPPRPDTPPTGAPATDTPASGIPLTGLPVTSESGTDASTAGWLLARVAAEARAVFSLSVGEARDLIDALTEYWPSVAGADRHFADVRASARALCSDFAAPPIARTVYFGCEPGLRAGADAVPDLARAVSPRIGGPLFVFQPSRGRLDLVAVALKALLFEAVLDDPDRQLGHPGLPLVCYVADECQRFVTHDPIHGEAGFIEASHTYGTCCVLACPSLSSLEQAFSARGATAEESRAAAALLWTSTATKLVFRTTDRSTIDRVAELAPRRPGLVPAVRVRPLSELPPGECVALTAGGRFERRWLEPSPLVDALRCVWPVPAPVLQACGASPDPGGASSDLPALPAPSAPEPAPAGTLPEAGAERDADA